MENFRARVKFSASAKRYFSSSSASTSSATAEGRTLELAARVGESLHDTSHFHIEAGGFGSIEAATEYARKIKKSLRILAAATGEGVHLGEGEECINLEQNPKSPMRFASSAASVIIMPDIDNCFEDVAAGVMHTATFNADDFLDRLGRASGHADGVNDKTMGAIEYLVVAAQAPSDSVKFLLTYIAMEKLVVRQAQSDAVQATVDALTTTLDELSKDKEIPLTAEEIHGLRQRLGELRKRSTTSMIVEWARSNDDQSCGEQCRERFNMSFSKFISICISSRHKVAHDLRAAPEIPYATMAAILRDCICLWLLGLNVLVDLDILGMKRNEFTDLELRHGLK